MAFLVSAEGLGLEVTQDRRTEEAIGRALTLLADADVKTFAGRRLDADDFDRLSVADPIRDLLQWLNAPERFEQTQAARWVSFRNRCQSEFQIDPADGPDAAIKALAEGHPPLDPVWFRFCESPISYPGVTKLLRSPASLAIDASRNPAINETFEGELRKALEGVAGLDQATVTAKVMALEAQHKERRSWVWARSGQSPWAMALEPLVALAKLSKSPIGGSTVDAAASSYASDGYPPLRGDIPANELKEIQPLYKGQCPILRNLSGPLCPAPYRGDHCRWRGDTSLNCQGDSRAHQNELEQHTV